jgi:hypothetical protein
MRSTKTALNVALCSKNSLAGFLDTELRLTACCMEVLHLIRRPEITQAGRYADHPKGNHLHVYINLQQYTGYLVIRHRDDFRFGVKNIIKAIRSEIISAFVGKIDPLHSKALHALHWGDLRKITLNTGSRQHHGCGIGLGAGCGQQCGNCASLGAGALASRRYSAQVTGTSR